VRRVQRHPAQLQVSSSCGTPGAALLRRPHVARGPNASTWALIADDPDRTNVLAATYLNRLAESAVIRRQREPGGRHPVEPGGAPVRTSELTLQPREKPSGRCRETRG